MTNKEKELKEEIERKGLICKIGKRYYYGSVNLTRDVKQIIEEATQDCEKTWFKKYRNTKTMLIKA